MEILDHPFVVWILLLVVTIPKVLIRRLHQKDEGDKHDLPKNLVPLSSKFGLGHLVCADEVEVENCEATNEPDRNKAIDYQKH